MHSKFQHLDYGSAQAHAKQSLEIVRSSIHGSKRIVTSSTTPRQPCQSVSSLIEKHTAKLFHLHEKIKKNKIKKIMKVREREIEKRIPTTNASHCFAGGGGRWEAGFRYQDTEDHRNRRIHSSSHVVVFYHLHHEVWENDRGALLLATISLLHPKCTGRMVQQTIACLLWYFYLTVISRCCVLWTVHATVYLLASMLMHAQDCDPRNRIP